MGAYEHTSHNARLSNYATLMDRPARAGLVASGRRLGALLPVSTLVVMWAAAIASRVFDGAARQVSVFRTTSDGAGHTLLPVLRRARENLGFC